MDPMTVLLSALSLASSAAQPVADQAIKDGYAGLKALIVRKFGEKSPQLESSLTSYEQKPEVWKEPVKDLLQTAGADRDQEVLERAAELLQRAGGGAPGAVTVTASGERSTATGGGVSGSIFITGNHSQVRRSA